MSARKSERSSQPLAPHGSAAPTVMPRRARYARTIYARVPVKSLEELHLMAWEYAELETSDTPRTKRQARALRTVERAIKRAYLAKGIFV